LLGSIDQQSSVNAKVDDLKASTPDAAILGLLSSPDLDQLLFLEEVDSGTISTDVEVLFEISAFLEAHLSQITAAIVSEKNLPTRLQNSIDVLHSLLPLRW
jgi:hypothetical protein